MAKAGSGRGGWSGTPPAEVVLALESSDQPPFDYQAELTYALAGSALTMRLAVLHRGAVAAPYGLGFHPWLPRTPGTLIELPASEVWLETADHMPAGKVPIAARPDWDFARWRPLPTDWINNGFSGWSGHGARALAGARAAAHR